MEPWGADARLMTLSRHRAGCNRRGRLSLAQLPGRRPGPSPARHTGVACSRNARLRDQTCDRPVRHDCSLRCIAVGRVAGHVPRATPRSRLPSKMSQGRNSPAAGQKMPRLHRRQDCALAAPGDWLRKSSDRLHRASPAVRISAVSPLVIEQTPCPAYQTPTLRIHQRYVRPTTSRCRNLSSAQRRQRDKVWQGL